MGKLPASISAGIACVFLTPRGAHVHDLHHTCHDSDLPQRLPHVGAVAYRAAPRGEGPDKWLLNVVDQLSHQMVTKWLE